MTTKHRHLRITARDPADLHRAIVRNPASTYFVRVAGESMLEAGLRPGDLLVVDSAVAPSDESIVVASVGGELTVKRLRKVEGRLYLMPQNPQYSPVEVSEPTELTICGVVTHVIHEI